MNATLCSTHKQVKGAEKVLYGLDDIAGESEVIIVEGEIDKLSLEEAGFRNVVSVPDGAPQRVREGGLPPPVDDTKYAYLWSCRAWLDQALRVVIATDNDAPGDALAEELARRLGRERCWRVKWASTWDDAQAVAGADDSLVGDLREREQAAADDEDGFRKDANEVLVHDGPAMLKAYVQNALPLPIRGLFR